jgi:ABC-type antimicrobial peptide transport system permease subunit
MSIVQRRKEIGIRMVMGAKIANILYLLSKNFRNLILIAMLMAYPVAYFAMSQWLQDFAYRVKLQWYWFIGVPFVVSMAIVVILISSLSIKIIKSNPIESIREE